MRTGAILFLLLAITLACGCREKTKAHLEQFLDTEGTAKDGEAETFDPLVMPEDPEVADAINMASFNQVAKLLHAHRFQAKIHFRFEGSQHRVSIKEEDTIILARNGDFIVKVENNRGQGYESIFSNGSLFIRNRYGPYHIRSSSTEEHLRIRDQAYSGWASVYRLFRGRLKFTKLGLTTYHGRNGVRFSIGLSTGKPRLPGTVEPPEVPEGITKYVHPIKPTKSYQDRWRDKIKPWQVKGTLILDGDTGVILAGDLSGQWQFYADLPQNEPDPNSSESLPVDKTTWSNQVVTLHVWAKIQTDGFGNPSSISAPSEKSIQPIPKRTHVETHPLDFYFGKGYTAKLGKPAGVAGDSKTE